MISNATSNFSDLSRAAWAYLDGGLSLVPIDTNSKRPASLFLPQEQDASGNTKATWLPYQERLPTPDELRRWLSGGVKAFAAVCGPISGGLLILDFEFEDYFHRWHQEVGELADALTIQRTGGGGYHVAFRCPQPGPSQKLAWHPDTDNPEGRVIAIETRGERSMAIVAPSLHPSGNSYQMIQGDFAHIPHISQAVATVLLQAARDLDQAPLSYREREHLDQQTQEWDQRRRQQTDRPSVIDAYNQRIAIKEALLRYGYKPIGCRFTRPNGTSPSVYIDVANNRSYHHSTNDPLATSYWQKPFDVLCHYEHNGNVKVAVKAAAQEIGLDQALSIQFPALSSAISTFGGLSGFDPHLPATGEVATYLLTEGADDEGNAQCVNRLYGKHFLYTDAYGWLHYNDHCWGMQEAEYTLDRKIVETLQIRRSAAVAVGLSAEAVVKAAKPSSRHVRDCKYLFRAIAAIGVDEFDNDPDLLNCRNGVLDLRTGDLLTHEPSQRFTYCIPTNYNPNADMTPWLDFLGGVLKPGDGMDNYLRQAVGYSLTGHTSEEILFYLYGPTRSGKGTFTETLLALLQNPLATETDFSTFTSQRKDDNNNFDLAPLKPCRLVAASESNQYERLNAGVVKSLTGGNYIRCAFKHKTHFSYRPQYKIWLSSNHPVNADVDDEALWYRLRVIEFPNSFADREDKKLKKRLKRSESLEGVLAWAVLGAREWYQSPKGLLTPSTVNQSTDKQRDDLDHLQQWLSECCEQVEDHWTANHLLYQSYESWCEANGVAPKKERQFGRGLSHKGLQTSQKQRVAGKEFRGVIGLKLLETPAY